MQIKFGNNPCKLLQDADWALLLGAVPRSKGSILAQAPSCVLNCEALAHSNPFKLKLKSTWFINGRIYQEQVGHPVCSGFTTKQRYYTGLHGDPSYLLA